MFWKKETILKPTVRSHNDITQDAGWWKLTGIIFQHTKPLTSLAFTPGDIKLGDWAAQTPCSETNTPGCLLA